MINFLMIFIVWALILLETIIHEIGHLPTAGIRVIKYFPFPEMASISALSRTGGLIINTLIAVGIAIWRPENIYIQLFGLINFVHVVIYFCVGSFNFEPKIPNNLIPFTVFDDVDNKLRWIFVPAAIILLVMYGTYYVSVAQNIWAAIVI